MKGLCLLCKQWHFTAFMIMHIICGNKDLQEDFRQSREVTLVFQKEGVEDGLEVREAGGKLITTLHTHLSLHTLWINFYSPKPDAYTPIIDADNLLVSNSLLGVI